MAALFFKLLIVFLTLWASMGGVIAYWKEHYNYRNRNGNFPSQVPIFGSSLKWAYFVLYFFAGMSLLSFIGTILSL